MRCGAVAFIQMPSSRSRAANAAAVPSSGSTSKITMFVSMTSGSSRKPGVVRMASARMRACGVIFGQAVDVVLERVERAGGDDAGLAHAAAERFAMSPGLADQVSGAAQGRADRCAQAFREADAHGVEVAGPIGGRNARGDDGVEQPRAVEVAGEAVFGGPAADFRERVVRLNPTRAAIVCVFQAHEPRADAMIVRRPDAADELLDLQHAVVAFDRLGGDAEQLGVGALFVAQDVAIGFAQEFVAGLAVHTQAELVAHRAGGNVESRFFAQHLGDPLLESPHGGVVAEHVVADVGGGHGGAHARASGGSRYRYADRSAVAFRVFFLVGFWRE